MDVPADNNEPLMVKLEDGHEWKIMRQWQDAQQFAGLYVAYRTHDEALIAGAYHIDPCATYYGSVSLEKLKWRLPDFAGVRCCHVLYKSFLPNRLPVHGFNLTNDRLRSCKLSMRLLTLAEARHLDARLEPWRINLCNLMESEQCKYLRNHVRKTIWPKQRLLHIATKESSSILFGFPRDLILLITRHVIDAEAHELQKADPDMHLLFEHKKELP
jgi:hypothetical protein